MARPLAVEVENAAQVSAVIIGARLQKNTKQCARVRRVAADQAQVHEWNVSRKRTIWYYRPRTSARRETMGMYLSPFEEAVMLYRHSCTVAGTLR